MSLLFIVISVGLTPSFLTLKVLVYQFSASIVDFDCTLPRGFFEMIVVEDSFHLTSWRSIARESSLATILRDKILQGDGLNF